MELPLENATESVRELLESVQKGLLEKARKRRDERIVYADDMAGILAGVEAGNFVKAGWCGCRACEDKIKEDTAATSRCMPFAQEELSDKCVCCGKPATKMVYWGRAY